MFDKNKFKAQIVLKGYNVKGLSEALGMHETTFYRKMNDDGDFTRSEISTLCEILEIERPDEIFFA